MKIEEYAAMRDKYPMPADAAGIGTASDPETGDVIAIGVVTRRRTYNKTGYICQKDARPSCTPAPARCWSWCRTCQS